MICDSLHEVRWSRSIESLKSLGRGHVSMQNPCLPRWVSVSVNVSVCGISDSDGCKASETLCKCIVLYKQSRKKCLQRNRMEYDYIMWLKVYIYDIWIYIYLKYLHDNMAAPPGMNPWTSCHLLHEPDGLLHLPTREMAVAYHRCVFMSWPRMETHGDPDGWSARQMTDLCFSQWEDMMIRQEDVGSAQCSTTLNQHVLFTQTKNLLCQGRPGSTCYFCMRHVYYCIC